MLVQGLWVAFCFVIRSTARDGKWIVLTVLLTGIGTGAALVAAGLLDAALLNPLRLPGAASLFVSAPGQAVTSSTLDSLLQTVALSDVAAQQPSQFTISHQQVVRRTPGVFVVPSYFRVLRPRFVRGRGFQVDSEFGVVVSFRLWEREYQADSTALAQGIVVNDTVLPVLGVTEAAFLGTSLGAPPQLFVPRNLRNLLLKENRPHQGFPDRWFLVGRLHSGSRLEDAQKEVAFLGQQLSLAHGLSEAERIGLIDASEAALPAQYRPTTETLLRLIAAAAVLVLLLTYANSAFLLIWRMQLRERNLAIASLLGASHKALVVQSLWELLFVCLGIVVVAGIVATVTARMFTMGGPLSRLFPVAIVPAWDWLVALSALVLLGLWAIVCGLLPLRLILQIAPVGALGRGARDVKLAPWPRRWLVGCQFALGMGLLTCALALFDSIARQHSFDWGFDPSNVVTSRVPSSMARNGGLQVLYTDLVATLQRVPQIRGVALSATRPFGGLRIKRVLWNPRTGARAEVFSNLITAKYFEVLGIPVLRGQAADNFDGFIVNEALANDLWASLDVVGKSIKLADDGPSPAAHQVVAVVRDTVYESPDERHTPLLYLPLHAEYPPAMSLLVRTQGVPTPAIEAIGAAYRAVAPQEPQPEVSTMNAVLQSWTAQPTAVGTVLGSISLLAILLTTAGLCASLGYWQSTQKKDIAIRMALGATPRQVAGRVLAECGIAALIGVTLGIPLALAGKSLLTHLLFEAQYSTIGALGNAVLFTAVAALSAGVIPAWRSAMIDPSAVLKLDQ